MLYEVITLGVLHKIHELDPLDNTVIQELAILYLDKNELFLSRDYFARLPDGNCWNIQCLQARNNFV